MVPRTRSIVRPGVPLGTMIIDICWCGGFSGFVLHMTMKKSAVGAFDVNHFRPLITHSSPSRVAVVSSSVGSAPAFGSVIEKPLRSLPSSNGCIHFFFCSSSPPTAMSSALPESGAMLPNTCEPNTAAPMSSCMSASFT